jgi:hypothetical protein
MAARSIRNMRQGPGAPMGRLGVQPARAPHFGRPVMTKSPMVRPSTPPGLPPGNPTAVQGPIPVSPGMGPPNIGPAAPKGI